MLIKNKTKFTFLVVALFFAAISFIACNNNDSKKVETPAVQSDQPATPAVDDSTTIKGNTKPTPVGNQ